MVAAARGFTPEMPIEAEPVPFPLSRWESQALPLLLISKNQTPPETHTTAIVNEEPVAAAADRLTQQTRRQLLFLFHMKTKGIESDFFFKKQTSNSVPPLPPPTSTRLWHLARLLLVVERNRLRNATAL